MAFAAADDDRCFSVHIMYILSNYISLLYHALMTESKLRCFLLYENFV